MAVWMVLEGTGTLTTPAADHSLRFGKGNVLLLPAALSASTVHVDDATTLLEVTVPA